jgi:hypothetical protein
MSNLAPPKTSTQKKALVVYKAKKTSAKVPKAKAPIILPKILKKTPAKAPIKAIVVKEVEEVVIC